MEPGIAMLFNIRPWSESPNQVATAWPHPYLVDECGNNLAAGAIALVVRLGGDGQFTE